MEPALLLGAGALGATAAYLAPALARPFAVADLRRRARERRALVLTYDDGPGPRTTERLVELLARHAAHATFFVSGRRAAERPEQVAALVAAGHEVGSHGFDHVHAWRASPWRVARDVARGAAVVPAPPGGPALYRPPYGKATLVTAFAAARADARVGWWTHDSGDTHDPLPAELGCRTALLDGGGVLLLHDLDRSAPRNEFVLAVTADLLAAAPEHGLEVMTLGALLA